MVLSILQTSSRSKINKNLYLKLHWRRHCGVWCLPSRALGPCPALGITSPESVSVKGSAPCQLNTRLFPSVTGPLRVES